MSDYSALRPKSCAEALQLPMIADFYPNIACVIRILATIPVSTATAEKTFSCLHRLKTYLRSTMGEDRLSRLTHMTLNGNGLPSNDDILDELAKKPHRLGPLT